MPPTRSERLVEGRIKTMRKLAIAIVVTAGIVGGSGPAVAADLTAADIKALAIGKTVYIETTAASVTGTPGQGMIYWAEDGTALYKTPSGAMWSGTWQFKDNTLCTEWKQRPGAACARWDKAGEAVSIIDSASGQTRAKVVKTATGNAEKLAP
jgi:hypothetical protein